MTYEYSCLCCKNQFEAEQSIADKVGADCPKCRVWCENRLISGGTSFALKGTGWAADSYSSTRDTRPDR